MALPKNICLLTTAGHEKAPRSFNVGTVYAAMRATASSSSENLAEQPLVSRQVAVCGEPTDDKFRFERERKSCGQAAQIGESDVKWDGISRRRNY